ncbi:SRPBCC family protein [Hyalangium rubrum]|uniref:SRPBCC family protein n=1 Tax=Hyalangium rubrum TaxID=3103134 RepID=A0ABU5GZ44_9BACT|nr:SRPBCC family protein [Hyalangium sp. s54d21]MDY7226149.1 SRPBCC family protein [Hyalangium sp. s54d21]
MSTQLPIVARVTRRFTHPPERVFDAWLDPQQVRRWMAASIPRRKMASTAELLRVEIDARVGGTFSFVELRDGEEVEHTGEYLELDRPRRLVFTWAVPKYSADRDRVSIDIVPQDTGCELTLLHEMKPEWAEYESRTVAGWTLMIDSIAGTLG